MTTAAETSATATATNPEETRAVPGPAGPVNVKVTPYGLHTGQFVLVDTLRTLAQAGTPVPSSIDDAAQAVVDFLAHVGAQDAPRNLFVAREGYWMHAPREGEKEGIWVRDSNATYISGIVSAVLRSIRMGLKAMVFDADDKTEDAKMRKAATRSINVLLSHIRQIVQRLETMQEIQVDADDFDRDPYLLGVTNGVLDLHPDRRGPDGLPQLLPPCPSYMMTLRCRVPWNGPGVDAPTWRAFCTSSAGGDDELRHYRQRRAGSYLTATPDKILEVSYDEPRNGESGNTGKSSYYGAIARTMGDYGAMVPAEVFEARRGDKHPASLMTLKGKRFAYGAELDQKLDITAVKTMTGETQLQARGMGQDWQTLERTWKVAVFANGQPKIPCSPDDAIWNRVCADRWDTKVQNPLDSSEVQAIYDREGSGILAYMVQGLISFQDSGLRPPKRITALTDQYRRDQDPLASWIDECCDVTDPEAITPFAELQASRLAWLQDNDPNVRETAKRFGTLLNARFPSGHSAKGNTRQGITIKVQVPMAKQMNGTNQ